MVLNVPPLPLFSYLSLNINPITSKLSRYSEVDKAFIKKETNHLLREGIIEHSNSPWRAQVLTKKYRQKNSWLLITLVNKKKFFSCMDFENRVRVTLGC